MGRRIGPHPSVTQVVRALRKRLHRIPHTACAFSPITFRNIRTFPLPSGPRSLRPAGRTRVVSILQVQKFKKRLCRRRFHLRSVSSDPLLTCAHVGSFPSPGACGGERQAAAFAFVKTVLCNAVLE